jgi:nucleoside-diphosphate-sugar epimerase
MTFMAKALGAKPPRHVPASLVRLGAGAFLVYLMCEQPAVSSERARTELGWSPRHPDWHEGLTAVFSGS